MDLEKRTKRAAGPLKLPTCFVAKRQEARGGGEETTLGFRRNDRRATGNNRGRPLIFRPAKLLASLSSAVGFNNKGVAMTKGGSDEGDRETQNKSRRRRSMEANSAKERERPATDPTLALVAQIPKPAYFFAAGAIAGAIGKTVTAPLDRIKVLLQVKGGFSGAAVVQAAQSGGFFPTMRAIFREEGLRSFWKGNVPQVIRVLPYSAMQLYGYEQIKVLMKVEEGDQKWRVAKSLVAGATAGMIATIATYPLDTIRLRMAVDASIKSMPQAIKLLGREGGVLAFYRGVGPAMIGVAPYMGMELACFDFLKRIMKEDQLKGNTGVSFGAGFVAALMASSCTYPLDTIRRQIQLQGGSMLTMPRMVKSILVNEGPAGLYRGFIPSCLKNLPNKGIRLATFDSAKTVMAMADEATKETAAEEAKEARKNRRRSKV
jgi:solute carrier family 25 phosphate transporter 23/24/25/41